MPTLNTDKRARAIANENNTTVTAAGILSNVTAKELQKQKGKIKAYRHEKK